LVTIGCIATIRQLIGQLVNYFSSDDSRIPFRRPLVQDLTGPDPPAPRLSTTTSTPSVPASASASVLLGNSSSSTTLPSVSFINAAAYARVARLPGSTVFTLTVSASDTDTTSASAFSAKVELTDLSNIPEEYHEFQDVFSKAKAGNLAPHRPYDLKIDLEENAQPPIRRMYPLSEHELEALWTFLDENLRTNFVRPSRSAHGVTHIVRFHKR